MKYKPNAERIAELVASFGVRQEPKRQEPKPPAEVVPFPPKLSEQELMRRQAVIDQTWERNLVRWQELEAEYGRTCHRGPGDPDYWRQ